MSEVVRSSAHSQCKWVNPFMHGELLASVVCICDTFVNNFGTNHNETKYLNKSLGSTSLLKIFSEKFIGHKEMLKIVGSAWALLLWMG